MEGFARSVLEVVFFGSGLKTTFEYTMKWTPEEDSILSRLCREQQQSRSDGRIKDWSSIANSLPHRSNKDCRKRWYNVVSGSTIKGNWSQEEDERLVTAINQTRTSWAAVSEIVGSRSADQCAKRWQHNLNPELDNGTWTKEESETDFSKCDILLEAVRSKGRKWLEIRDDHFPKRGTNNIKNQYHIITRSHCCPLKSGCPSNKSRENSFSSENWETKVHSSVEQTDETRRNEADYGGGSFDLSMVDATNDGGIFSMFEPSSKQFPSVSGSDQDSMLGSSGIDAELALTRIPSIAQVNFNEPLDSAMFDDMENMDGLTHYPGMLSENINPSHSNLSSMQSAWSAFTAHTNTGPAGDLPSDQPPRSSTFPDFSLAQTHAISTIPTGNLGTFTVRITIREANANMIADIMSLVMTYNGQASVELENDTGVQSD